MDTEAAWAAMKTQPAIAPTITIAATATGAGGRSITASCAFCFWR